MNPILSSIVLSLAGASSLAINVASAATTDPVHLGPRPFYLVDQLEEGELKEALQTCAATTTQYERRNFSIAHRGASLQFPEHTMEAYLAAHRMGAGIIECDVTFTSDAELVCRHAQCDLHTTTNILATPLAEKCSIPFAPAQYDEAGEMIEPASARCCASDLTLEEFKSLEGKMDSADSSATTVEAYMGGTADFRTDLYATGATLMSHKESIQLIGELGGQFTPELKSVTDGFGDSGLTQANYARKFIQDYVDAGIYYDDVWPQSFDIEDTELWIREFPTFGKQAVWLDGRDPAETAANPPSQEDFAALKQAGLNIVAPPMPVLLTTDEANQIVPSTYAINAKAAGMDMISWSSDRSGRIVEEVLEGGGTYYYQSTLDALKNDGDILKTIDVLAQDVGVIGVFSDWPATTTFYANCMGMI
ncbi:glycerophosphodiester phosphodiesterase family protein [Granulosicoccus antarcticus]|uniref:glycerophosphodiester phosphodiesterase n=1 Tax=Granulosicoccus antarcticus IMCC3135 TaxID=1192854 RepID=A0A2Z2NUY4_9GAMM|nr:glycerophosphodiester phosphodiesterase family protein [Granulosicoccus antarcticus]ASJ74325.1 putative glycerophosphoryl diester phosphodiesterase 1 [Granulosicoccus antarcticus IMCC3135]